MGAPPCPTWTLGWVRLALDGTGYGSDSVAPLTSLGQPDAVALPHQGRAAVAKEILSQREQVDQALNAGTRSPDGRFVVGHVNLGGLANTEDVVIGERGRPERRYAAPDFTDDKDYRWLDARTILFSVYVVDQEFYAVDASTGAMTLLAEVPFDPPWPSNPNAVVDFGVSSPDRFWYKTADGVTHEVPVARR